MKTLPKKPFAVTQILRYEAYYCLCVSPYTKITFHLWGVIHYRVLRRSIGGVGTSLILIIVLNKLLQEIGSGSLVVMTTLQNECTPLEKIRNWVKYLQASIVNRWKNYPKGRELRLPLFISNVS